MVILTKSRLEHDLAEEIVRQRRLAEDTLQREAANRTWALVALLERALEEISDRRSK